MKNLKENIIGKYFGNNKTIISKIVEIGDIEKLREYSNELEYYSIDNIIKRADNEKKNKALTDNEKIAFIGIDIQNSFMPNGELGIEEADKDVKRIVNFIWENMDKITKFYVTLDSHRVFHIFMPSWWSDKNGNPPKPFTVITPEDIENKKWTPCYNQNETLECLKFLKRPLVVWNYHTIEGTEGESLERNFANILYFHSRYRESEITFIKKGFSKESERYGAFKPEYNPNFENEDKIVNEIWNYDKIIFAGEARSHCLLESINQFIEGKEENKELMKKIYILEDCSADIIGFEEYSKTSYDRLKKLGINIVKSSNFKL